MAPVGADVGSGDPVSLPQAKGHIGDALQGLHRVGVVSVGHHAVGGHTGKFMEGFLNIRQILEVVQVVRLHVQHNGDGRVEIQKGVAVFAAFQHNGVAIAHPVSGVEQGQIAADHHRGIGPRLHENVGHHRGGRGLSVGAGNADGIFIGFHNFAPGLGPLEYRDPGGPGRGDLRIVIVGGGSADQAVGSGNVPGVVADVHMDAVGDQFVCRYRGAHIRTGNGHAHSLQHKSQRPHGYAPDAHQMHMAARLQVCGNILIFIHVSIPRTKEKIRDSSHYTSSLRFLQP